METYQLTEEQLKSALCEVRKAHRLIYEYQRRMQDLTWFIKNKLGFPEYNGWKFFGDTMSPQHTISLEKKSWDWLYTYFFDYLLGYKTLGDKEEMGLGLIQITDTGYYKAKKGKVDVNEEKPSTFSSEEDSDNVLMFYLLKGVEPCNHWKEVEMIEEYATVLGFTKQVSGQHTHCIYNVPLYRFENEEATMQILREFVQYCNKNAGTNLQIQE